MTSAALPARGPLNRVVGVYRRLGPILRLLGPQRPMLIRVIATGIATQILAIVLATIGAVAVGEVAIGAGERRIAIITAVMIVLVVPTVLAPLLESLWAHVMSFILLANMRRQAFAQIDRLAPAYLLDRRSGDLARAAVADIELIEVYTAHTLPPLITTFVVPPLAVIALLFFHWTLALALLPFLAGAATAPAWLARLSERQGEQVKQRAGDLSADVVDGVQGLREVLVFGASDRELAKLAATERRLADVSIAHGRRTAFERASADLMISLGMLAVLVAGAVLVSRDDLSPGRFPAALILAASSFIPIASLAGAARELNQVAAAAERILTVLGASPTVVDLVERSPRVDAFTVRFQGVSFGYVPGQAALRDVNFEVPAGQTVALVGHSGAGKTTCANLLLRMWDPQAGSITLGGHDLRDFLLDDLRALVTYVPQDVYLFNIPARDNIRLGREDATQEEIEAAARQAQALDFIEGLPDGWDPLLGERGAQLSGGQRQRIAVARALLKASPVVIMDEAVSSLDAEAEVAMQKAVAEVTTGRTTLVIAHRPSTIRLADRIVVLSGGAVVEQGTFDELAAARGEFSRLLRLGFADETAAGEPAP